MGVFSLRLESEVERMITDLSKKNAVTKSDMVRILIMRGLEMEPKSNEIFDEILESTLSINSIAIKNFKATAQILANTIGILKTVDENKIETAKEMARKYLEKHEVDV